jgi:DNA-binding NarL/FixJ family response regulator
LVSLRVVVIGEDPLARAGLVALASHPTLSVVAQGRPADAARLALDADVFLWDAGSEAEPSLPPDSSWPVLVLIADDRQAAAALAAGARGVLPREVAAPRLALAVAAVHEGLVVLDEALAQALPVRTRPASRLAQPLTPRELEVLALLSEGLSNKAIASRLGLSESTAKFHVAAILGKLGVDSRAEAIVQAARLGLVVL